MSVIEHAAIIHATRRWVEKAVIGLELCPFAKGVDQAGLVRYAVTGQRSAAGLIGVLRDELLLLQSTATAQCETTLLIHPWVLNDFLEFNEFLCLCDATVSDLGLEGDIQVASFHPQYQFAGTTFEDIENYTNRAPFPTLHLLREASVERALETIEDPDRIYLDNMARLRALGLAGWHALWAEDDD